MVWEGRSEILSKYVFNVWIPVTRADCVEMEVHLVVWHHLPRIIGWHVERRGADNRTFLLASNDALCIRRGSILYGTKKVATVKPD